MQMSILHYLVFQTTIYCLKKSKIIQFLKIIFRTSFRYGDEYIVYLPTMHTGMVTPPLGVAT